MLLTYIAEIADEPFVLDPHDLDAETRTNTWSLYAPADERAMLSADQVMAAFEATATKVGNRALGLGPATVGTFYVWHDLQAGQLRCSTSSRPNHALPFRGPYTTTSALEPIISAFLEDPKPGTIEWDELTSAHEADDTASRPPTTLNIWVYPIGQRATDPIHG